MSGVCSVNKCNKSTRELTCLAVYNHYIVVISIKHAILIINFLIMLSLTKSDDKDSFATPERVKDVER